MFIFLNDVAVESLLCVPCNDTELSTAVRDGESMEGDTFYDNNSSLQSMQQLKYRKGEAHTNTVKLPAVSRRPCCCLPQKKMMLLRFGC